MQNCVKSWLVRTQDRTLKYVDETFPSSLFSISVYRSKILASLYHFIFHYLFVPTFDVGLSIPSRKNSLFVMSICAYLEFCSSFCTYCPQNQRGHIFNYRFKETGSRDRFKLFFTNG
jgi:hypothetical protein